MVLSIMVDLIRTFLSVRKVPKEAVAVPRFKSGQGDKIS